MYRAYEIALRTAMNEISVRENVNVLKDDGTEDQNQSEKSLGVILFYIRKDVFSESCFCNS